MNSSALEQALSQALALARKDHPDLAFDERQFRARLAQAAANDPKRLASLNSGDLLLAFAALKRDPAAEAQLDRRLVRATRAAIGARSTDADEREEVVQLVRHRVLVGERSAAPRLSRYDGEGSLVSWLRVVALSVAVDARRRDKNERKVGDSALMRVASSAPGADHAFGRAQHRAAFTAAFKNATALLDPQQRLLLRMRYVDQVPIEDIGLAFSVHRTTAMRWLEKAQADLLSAVREQLRRSLGLGARELDSLLKVIQPSLAERLSQVLAATAGPGD